CYDKINVDPYAKWTDRRVAGTPASWSDRVGSASRRTRAPACRFLEYPHATIPRNYDANARRRFPQALGGNLAAPYLNLLPCLPKPITTPSSGNRYTTTCGSNIPNGSSQMANPPS